MKHRIFEKTPENYIPGIEENAGFIHPDDKELYIKEFENSIQTGKPLDFDLRLVLDNGKLKHCNAKGNIVYSDDGKPLRFIGTFMDITERKRIEKDLEESEKKYRELVKYAPSGIYEIDFRTQKMTTINDAMTILTGYSKEELLSMNVFDLLDDESKLAFQQRVIKTNRGDKLSENMEYKAITKDGHVIDILLTMKFKMDENGKAIGAMVVGHDITERKQSEEKLRQNEERFRTSVESFSDGFVICSAIRNEKCEIVDFRYEYINEAAVRIKLNNFSRADHFGKTLLEITPSFQNSRLFADYTRITIEGGSVERDSVTFKEIYGRDDVDDRSFYFRITRLGDGVVVVWREITERKKFELELENKNAELIEINATKDKFFKIIAHDMKNPFISLIGASELLYENAAKYNPSKISTLTRVINESAKSGFDMLLNMLEWSQSQAGSIKFQPEKINLLDLINREHQSLYEFAFNKDIILNYDIPAGLMVYADKNMLNSILRNLINNALKFTPKGGKVIVSSKQENGSVVILVNDNGTGINQCDFDKLFRHDMKFSNPGTEHENGTGLGLLICKEFVEKHGGKIWVESEVEKGSKFYFSLKNLES